MENFLSTKINENNYQASKNDVKPNNDRTVRNLTLILFKKYKISFEETKVLKKYQKRKKRTSEYISQPQTNSQMN